MYLHILWMYIALENMIHLYLYFITLNKILIFLYNEGLD